MCNTTFRINAHTAYAWALEHYRLGLAGEGQADVIEKHLARHRGVVADVGCGPQGQHASNLARLCRWLIAVDKDPGMVRAASLDSRVIFNIKGNDYRLVVKINYPYRVVYIRFVGTHAEVPTGLT